MRLAQSLSPALFRHHSLLLHHHHPLPLRPSLLCSHLRSSRPISTPAIAAVKSTKKSRREAPENILRRKLDICSKNNDLDEALRLYDAAVESKVPLSLHHFNSLLYLCSSHSAIARGVAILAHLRRLAADIVPNEATFTSAARLAAADNNPNLALNIVKEMAAEGIPPKLRSYGPALFTFCKKGDFDGARSVEEHMETYGVAAEEPELTAILKVNSEVGRGDEVYRVLHKMRSTVRQVQESTAEVVEEWFESEAAEKVGIEKWDKEKVKDGLVNGGGGWHGQGWLGRGRWSVGRSKMDSGGVCKRCGEKLVCIDIDPQETEDFAKSVAALACQREAKSDFMGFQEWLERNGPFDAVVDGANVGLYNQHNFSFFQLNSIVNGIRQMSPSKKLPLVVLHTRRVRGGPAENPRNKKLLESWRRSGALYATPAGSNDDWYWLYAAVSCKSLLVTNDEMRDHLFQLLGSSFFPQWKEKHQVRLTVSKHGPTFYMPPSYSIVMQESEMGSWHIPTVIGDDIETPRQWVCATRNALAISYPHAKLGGIAL